jgi:predicted lipoprotein with Yx(FWY)xxD motif
MLDFRRKGAGRKGAGERGARGRSTELAVGMGVAALALAAGAALALAVSTASTVSSSTSPKLGEHIAVNAQGRTLYALSPETTHHLLCKSAECFKFWPPYTVRSRNAKLRVGSGVHGGLGILHRSNGMFQVTLRGMPLYRFAGDHARGQVNGQGLKSFGGTWHAVTAEADPKPAPAASEPAYGASGTSGGGGGGYGGSGTGTSTTTKPSSTTPKEEKTTPKEEKTTPKEEKTAPKEEKTTPKEEKTTPKETQAEKEAREKHEKEEYCKWYPTYPGC